MGRLTAAATLADQGLAAGPGDDRHLAEVLVAADSAANQVVLRTPPGAAAFLAAAVDAAAIDEVLGTIAGDDTVLLITRTPNSGPEVAATLIAMAEQRR